MPFKHFLGYDRGEGGVPVINEKEAEVVRLIYKLFLHGKTAVGICKHLESLDISTPSGKHKATKHRAEYSPKREIQG